MTKHPMDETGTNDIPRRLHVDGEDFRGVGFLGMDIQDSLFEECVFTGAVFRAANLLRSSFRECLLTGARFTWCDVQGLKVDEYDLHSIALHSPYAEEVILTPDNSPELKNALDDENTRPSIAEMDPSDSILADRLKVLAAGGRAAHFHRCIFQRATFRGTNLSSATFERCNLMGVSFILTDLCSVELTSCNVDGVSFNGIGLGLLIPELGANKS